MQCCWSNTPAERTVDVDVDVAHYHVDLLNIMNFELLFTPIRLSWAAQ